MKRRDGNHYERKLYYKRIRRVIGQSRSKKEGKRASNKAIRTQLREVLNKTPYDDTWDIATPGIDFWWIFDYGRGWYNNYKEDWKDNPNPKYVELSSAEIRRLPRKFRHEHIDNLRKQNDYMYRTRWRYWYISKPKFDTDKILAILKDIYFGEKGKYLKEKFFYYRREQYGAYNRFYSFMINREFPAYTLLDQWWHDKLNQKEAREAGRVWNVKYDIPIIDIAQVLKELGYNPYKDGS